ncbi:MAG: toxin-antitoxin system YwqK family antitoxin [Crocinitomicaceae bacterium]
MKSLLIALSLLFTISSIAQNDINKTDSQGRKQGVWKKAYPNAKVFRYVGQFKDDKPYGEFIYYYETGEVEATLTFSENGKVSRSKMYHRSGYLMAKGKYVNQQKDSVWIHYDDRGVISYMETYENGKLNGQKVYFYEPQDGKLHVARYEYYRDGLRHGEFKEYHQNTKVKIEGKFRDGNLDGKIVHYYPNGRVKKILYYKHAVEHGVSSFYSDDGKLVGTKTHWEGKLLKGEAAEAKMKLWYEQQKK